ncbi:MAG: ABC transporter ATP-binding protein [Lachnospiraceae bacterium]|nr:ABC transporter ATP-binding protein [Lachnospiraceae bacterium]
MEKKKLIEFRNIVKNFDGNFVLKGVNLDIYEKEFVTLLGPSGCGKTTLLRILGGFLDADEGSVIFDGEEISNKPPYERELNTVFQKYALFPHLSVFENIAFGLRIKKMSKDVIEQKVMKMLKLIGLEGYENKNVTHMSGGQQQRVAIARALVNEPKVLLLDEPLAALDLKLRKEMQYELKRIQQEVGITFIFVTHDQEEALTMSDKIVVMKGGEIQQVGTPEEIYNEPANSYVANFIGESNIIPGVMLEDYKVQFDDITFDCVDFGFKKNEKVDVVIRPEDIDIVEISEGKMTGEVLSVLFKGVHYEIMVETVPGTTVKVNMHVIRNTDVTSEDGKEKISANDFYVDIEDVAKLDDKEIIALSNAQAWNPETDEYTSIAKIEYELQEELGTYPVTFYTAGGISIEKKIFVVNQRVVKNEKANEAVMAFNFFITADEIKESKALDTDIKTWANAQGWKLSDENQSIDIDVDYEFDPEDINVGIYKVTFSTTGREFKIHTTDYSEVGQEVGLTFFPEDIHVMSKVVYE